jgi:hypothetical protein
MAKSIKGVTRIEYEGLATKGWMVRITRDGERKQKFFGDKPFGSKAKALKAAKECYDAWLEEVGPIRTTRDLKTVRNSSGKVGVHEVRNVDSRWANAESFAYCASWISEEGQRQKLSFAWNRYGKKAAWNLACLAREMQLADREAIVKLWEKKSGKKPKKAK